MPQQTTKIEVNSKIVLAFVPLHFFMSFKKRNFCFSYVCAIPAACCWGCSFACLAFDHIWCLTPTIKYYKISYYPLMRLYALFLQCLCVPFFEAMSLIFSKVGLYKNEGPPEYKSRMDEFESIMAKI